MLISSLHAQEIWSEIYYKNGLPSCMSSNMGTNVVFKVEKVSLYHQILTAIRTRKKCFLGFDEIVTAKREYIKESTESILEIPLEDKIKSKLNMILAGATEYNPYLSGHDFWEKNPGLTYNLQLNRELTKKYGMKFSNEVYESFLRTPKQQKETQALLNKIDHILEEGISPIYTKGENKLKVILSHGFGMGASDVEEKSQVERDLEITLSEVGINLEVLKKGPYSPIEENAEKIHQDLKRLLEGDDDFVLLLISKGLPDVMVSLKDLNITKRLKGIISVVGLSGGTFLCEAAYELNFVKTFEYLFSQNKVGQSITTSKTLCENDMRLRQEEYLAHFPMNIPLVEVVSIPSDYGKPSRHLSDTIKMAFDSMDLLKMVEGANDGIIEHPNTLLPENTFEKRKRFIIKGSHIVLDGFFENLDLTKAEIKKAFFNALATSVLEMSEKRD